MIKCKAWLAVSKGEYNASAIVKYLPNAQK
jgi:hypothetical protein